mmetsp:Transcript_28226/g.80954  ORF Transcript_28226/g.80954 Transcript_28226/m.80954 type:complete len:223 (-) Transcript_28226:40-708(-)
MHSVWNVWSHGNCKMSSSGLKSLRQMMQVGSNSFVSSSDCPNFTGRGRAKLSLSGGWSSSSELFTASIIIKVNVSTKQRMMLATRRMTHGTSARPLFKGVVSKYHMSKVIATPHRTSGQNRTEKITEKNASNFWPQSTAAVHALLQIGPCRHDVPHIASPRPSGGMRGMTMGYSLTNAIRMRKSKDHGSFASSARCTSTCKVGTTTAASKTHAPRTDAFPKH